MPLTRPTAKAIIDIVASDKACRQRIDDGFFSLFGRYSGPFRNAAFCLANIASLERCAPNSQQQTKICYGIAEATVDAINKVVTTKSKPPGLASVHHAEQIGRNQGRSGEHYATKIVLQTKTRSTMSYDNTVFDWWSTLLIDNPLIYSSATDFVNSRGGAPYSQFTFAKAEPTPLPSYAPPNFALPSFGFGMFGF